MGNKIIVISQCREAMENFIEITHLFLSREPLLNFRISEGLETQLFCVHRYVEMCLHNFPCRVFVKSHTLHAGRFYNLQFSSYSLLRGAVSRKYELSSYALIPFYFIESVLKSFPNQVHDTGTPQHLYYCVRVTVLTSFY